MKHTYILRTVAITCIALGVMLFLTVLYRNSGRADVPLVFSDRTMLSALWVDYRNTYWDSSSGRTINTQLDGITTSEAQGYTLLRAVWESDRATFDKAWEWTASTLQRDDDNLFMSKWGELEDGTLGIIQEAGGSLTHSGADTDIAFALLMAAARWQEQRYLDEARPIISDIWDKHVVKTNSYYVLSSNDQEALAPKDILINPSYYAPYAYKEFALVDQDNPWLELYESSYVFINQAMEAELTPEPSVKLPPDWVLMDKATGELSSPSSDQLVVYYGLDAIRVPWKLALDYRWNQNKAAYDTLAKMNYLSTLWMRNASLPAIIDRDGNPISNEEIPAVYGANLGYFSIIDQESGQQIYETKLKTLFNQNANAWTESVSFYSDNWTWFGMALFANYLDNPIDGLARSR
jgi:endoglucanase